MHHFQDNPADLMKTNPYWDIVRSLGRIDLVRALERFEELLESWHLPLGWKCFSQEVVKDMQEAHRTSLELLSANAIGFSPSQLAKAYNELGLEERTGLSVPELDINDIFGEVQAHILAHGATSELLSILSGDITIPKPLIAAYQSVIDAADAISYSACAPSIEAGREAIRVSDITADYNINEKFIGAFLDRAQDSVFHIRQCPDGISTNGQACHAFIKLDTRDTLWGDHHLEHTLAFAGIYTNNRPLMLASFTIEAPSWIWPNLKESDYHSAADQMEGYIRGIDPADQARLVLSMLDNEPKFAGETIHSLLLSRNGQPSKNAIVFLNDIQFESHEMDVGLALTCLLEEIISVCEQGAYTKALTGGWKDIEHLVFHLLTDGAKEDRSLRTLRFDPLCDHVRQIVIEDPMNLAEQARNADRKVGSTVADRQTTKLLLLRSLLQGNFPVHLKKRIHFPY